MRLMTVARLALIIAGCARAAESARAGGPRGLFISPMGEPFRGGADGGDPQQRWFDGADTDHDGALTRAEFERDAVAAVAAGSAVKVVARPPPAAARRRQRDAGARRATAISIIPSR